MLLDALGNTLQIRALNRRAWPCDEAAQSVIELDLTNWTYLNSLKLHLWCRIDGWPRPGNRKWSSVSYPWITHNAREVSRKFGITEPIWASWAAGENPASTSFDALGSSWVSAASLQFRARVWETIWKDRHDGWPWPNDWNKPISAKIQGRISKVYFRTCLAPARNPKAAEHDYKSYNLETVVSKVNIKYYSLMKQRMRDESGKRKLLKIPSD